MTSLKKKKKTLLSYLKKSFLQKSFPSLLKHLSAKAALQSWQRTHSACHVLSRTLRRNLSKIGLSQPAQASNMPPLPGSPPGTSLQRPEIKLKRIHFGNGGGFPPWTTTGNVHIYLTSFFLVSDRQNPLKRLFRLFRTFLHFSFVL